MTREFIDEMKEALKAEKNAILDKLARQDSDFKDLVSAKTINDSIDSVTEELAFSKIQFTAVHDYNKLQAINNAISRIHNKQYGYCFQCGKEIPENRLRAIPYAVVCVECKNNQEKETFRRR
ncbi:MAG: TraR/DksA family transcriptional regulator [Spirochaetia bacterium]|nr:TraR/DksA family transcriptional regulator [Spirochaetia bacterium]